jgi:hypothetical protein
MSTWLSKQNTSTGDWFSINLEIVQYKMSKACDCFNSNSQIYYSTPRVQLEPPRLLNRKLKITQCHKQSLLMIITEDDYRSDSNPDLLVP